MSKSVSLNKLINDNHMDLNFTEDIIVNKVKINLDEKLLSVDLKSFNIIDGKDIDNLKEKLKERFNEFSVKINIKYEIENFDKKDNINKYFNNIMYLIDKETPANNPWKEYLNWHFSEDTFYIEINNRIVYDILEKNGIIRDIDLKIHDEVNKKAQFKLINKNDDIDSKEEFLKGTLNEEKILSKAMIENQNKVSNNKTKEKRKSSSYTLGKKIEEEPIDISEINSNISHAVVKGEIFNVGKREIKGGKKLYIFNITDYTNSITVKSFVASKKEEEMDLYIKEGTYGKAEGDIIFDTYSKQLVLMMKNFNIMDKPKRMDSADEKRVELHLHTQMSSMDGINSFSSLVERASQWGHKAIAITDHGVVQGFPEGMEAGKKYNIKILYGLEGYMVNDKSSILSNPQNTEISDTYVVFDIETTGLSPNNDKITEIGAVKIKNGEILERYNQLINPEIPIPEKIVDLTGITDELVKDKPKISEILPDFYSFIEGANLVAHNASFDVGFIRENLKLLGIDLKNPVIDTLELCRSLFPTLRNHKLNTVAKHLNVSLENHHRAVDDAKATADIFLICLDILKKKGIQNISEINKKLSNNKNLTKEDTYHIIIFAKNLVGIKNLYRLVTESHLNYFYRKPRIPKSLIENYREGLLIGSACEAGELYRGIIRNKDDKDIDEIVKFYDYLEIQPIGNNMHLVKEGIVKDEEELKNINRKIVELGEKFDKTVVATGDVHFLDPKDEIYRRILMYGQGFHDAEDQPPLYFKTTDEMLEEFSYLGEKKAEEVVIKNTNFIADKIEEFLPIPDGTFPPVIENSDKELTEITHKRAKKIYGDPLPDIVKKRLERELNSIIKNGYAVMYIIAQKLVSKSLSDGYLVGSRGSVGSSFVATMSGITEVNPLPPHYICENCKYSEFVLDNSVSSGIDMEDKDCPKCGKKLIKEGYNIPFEVFLGFEGDKEPDIDLNFAGEYQPVAHKYTEELFGKGYVYRAGTIGTIAEKTAYGFVKKYFTEKDISVHPAEIERLVKGCTGIKRTSGQHPGGVMIVPKYKDILDFTPVQYPANDKKSGVITTHFDYHSISGRILKLDILGHDVPSIIRMLEDITGVDSRKIPLDDEKTMEIFVSADPLGISGKDINTEVGTLGIPEFGTKFVRQMLVDTKPTTFDELVRISGLAHGTDVWLNNAQELIKNKTATLKNVICTRDDIMLYLINMGLDNKRAFKIMERVRHGRGLTEEDEDYMRENNVPEWYINSCNKIKYMFPRAHAVAYVMMSFRIAYFKVHYPQAFYATYFTTKSADFDAELVLKGKSFVKSKIKELEDNGTERTAKEKNLLTVLEVVLEMYLRGLSFEKVDLYKSDSDKFIIGKEGIIPPLKSLQGVGETVARNIVSEREKREFISKEDLINRTKASVTVVEALENHGCLNGLPESNQISLFSV